MRIDLDAKVRTRDGEDAGSVERVIIEPRSNEITEFVIDTGGFLGRKVVVPREDVLRAAPDGDAIRLDLSKEELERRPAYIAAIYDVPPMGWMPPAAYGYPYSAYLWPTALAPGGIYAAPPAQPVTAPAAYGETYAATDAPVHPVRSGEDPAISKGAVVLDRGGDDVGVVDDVQFNATSGELRGFVLRVGGMLRTLFGGGDTVFVDARDVDRVDTELVRLNVTKDALMGQEAHGPQRAQERAQDAAR